MKDSRTILLMGILNILVDGGLFFYSTSEYFKDVSRYL